VCSVSARPWLNPDMFGAIQKKNLCMAIGVCYLMLVSMNLVILFTKGGALGTLEIGLNSSRRRFDALHPVP